MRVAVVAEYYPRAADPVLGIWAHRQAVAARDAGADVRVLVLHRLIPPRAALASRDVPALLAPLRQPRHEDRDGIRIDYVPFVAPPRPRSYGSWGAWAAPPLAAALRWLRRAFPFDLVHAHYASPAGDAARRARPWVPLVISAHGGDVIATAADSPAGRIAVQRAFAASTLVLANSRATERRCTALGARATRVVHLGADLPLLERSSPATGPLVTVSHLVSRKRHADVLRAMWVLRETRPDLRWVVVGDGPERGPLERLARELELADRVEFSGALGHADAVATAQSASLFVLPSVDEAFGVAYVEAMAGGVPAIGCRGEGGPEEIAAAGGGLRLVAPGDPGALAAEIDGLLSEPGWRREIAEQARRTVAAHFTWEACGRATVEAYAEALR